MDITPKPPAITGSWQVEDVPIPHGSPRKHLKVYVIAAPPGRSPSVIANAELDIPGAEVGMALAEAIAQAIKSLGASPLVVPARLVPMNGKGS